MDEDIKHSFWPFFVFSGCCGDEYISATLNSNFKMLSGIGTTYSHRQANLLVVSGVVTDKTLKMIKEWYNGMEGPKWVMAIGSCPLSGGVFDHSSNSLHDITEHVNVDVTVKGCPPAKDDIVNGLVRLQDIAVGSSRSGDER